MHIAMLHKRSDYVIYLTMWKKITAFIIVLLFIAILLHPSVITGGAKSGLELWINAVIPSLLPFMIISKMIIMTGFASDMNFIMLPITGLLRISPDAAYCIMSGLMFGYPSCAVSACEMHARGILDSDTAEFCTCCFNNISPAFIAGYFCTAIIRNSGMIAATLGIFYAATLISAVFLRHTVFRNLKRSMVKSQMPCGGIKKFTDSAIMSSLINISRLGGYIIIFSVVCNVLSSLNIPSPLMQILCSAAEITTGLEKMSYTGMNPREMIMTGIPLLSFGGICGMFQTFGVDTMSIISKKKYILSKTVTLIISGIVTYLAVYVFKIAG